MQSSEWGRLAAPFPQRAVTWRIEEIGPDASSARVRPQLTVEAVAGRLDEVVGRAGWSFRYRPFGLAVGCELEVDGVTKSAVCEPKYDGDGAEECSKASLARAAELFGLVPPTPVEGSYWVDYDPEENTALMPETSDLVAEVTATVHGSAAAIGPAGSTKAVTATPASDGGALAGAASPAAVPGESQGAERQSSEAVKPEGQQAIDRLLERLKLEGRGLEAARLLVEYGGYGTDPQTARELYGRLRELLTGRSETAPANGHK